MHQSKGGLPASHTARSAQCQQDTGCATNATPVKAPASLTRPARLTRTAALVHAPQVRWTKAYRKLAGKELADDATFELERRRNRPEKYNRETMQKTIKVCADQWRGS